VTEPTPLEDLVVNDRFWLGYARTTISESAKNRLATADKLVTAAGWFWTVYSSVAVVGVAVSDRDFSVGQVISIVLPIPALAIAYFLAVWAASTIEAEYDPRVPAEVAAVYDTRAVERAKRIKIAMGAIAVSAVLVVIAGVVASLSSSPKTSTVSLAAARTSSTTEVVVVAEVRADKDTPVMFEVKDATAAVVGSELVTTDDDRRAVAHVTVAGANGAGPLTVTASWVDEHKTAFALTSALAASTSG
jgi:hypothetical protein